MPSRRDFLKLGGLATASAAAGAFAAPARAQHAGHGGHGGGMAPPGKTAVLTPGPAPSAATRLTPAPPGAGYRPVVTLNGGALPWRMVDGAKEFRLVAEPVKREFAPGMVVTCWGYNGETPGPTIEVVEGDRVRILVENRLPEWTAVHWHGLILPNGMDGVAGLTQPHIPAGRTGVYEFTVREPATYMYHPHADEMFQIAMGMMGFLIVHPRGGPRAEPRVDRDYCIMLHAWDVKPGTAVPNATTMLDFNMWTFNSRVWPGTDVLVARTGERVRLRIANLSMTSHPIHLHGHHFTQTATDGGPIPPSARWPMNTVNVAVGSTADIEFTAGAPGDWALHCHKSHHTMNAMGHGLPVLTNVNQAGLARRMNALLPDYMAMGSAGMADMASMKMALPENTLPMMSGDGPFGPIEMGGMFTILKVRETLAPGDYRDPGWHAHPPGSVMRLMDA